MPVLLLHHLRKPSSQDSFETTESRVAGSYAIKGQCDRMLVLYKQAQPPLHVLATTNKFRGRKAFRQLKMHWDPTTLLFSLREKVAPWDMNGE